MENPSRRWAQIGLAAARPEWAAATGARFLSSARLSDRSHSLIALDGGGDEVFRIKLPGRGKVAGAHPRPPLAVAFVRRPERFAFVVHCAERAGIAGLAAPEGRYFYGHGAFLADGARLFTAENDDDAGTGRIGIWEAKHGFARIGEVASGGVGPHDVKLAADGVSPVVANGGARTHPSSGRAKLNAPTMRPNAALPSAADGRILDLIEPEADRRFASLRRLLRLRTVAFSLVGRPAVRRLSTTISSASDERRSCRKVRRRRRRSRAARLRPYLWNLIGRTKRKLSPKSSSGAAT
ncbi:MAG: DUF1513 domain-containing protein [Pseudomonadota bacterium]